MIKSVMVTNYLGEKIKMDLSNPYTSGFYIKSITGLGAGKANINIAEVSTNDGGLYNSARLSSRNIVLSLGFLDAYSIEETRHLSYKFFPIKKKVTLTIETDRRKLTIDGYTESNEPSIFSKSEGTEISIICPDPRFYSVDNEGSQETVFYGIDPMFEFPFSNNSLNEDLIIFSNIENKREQVVYYDGDSETGIVIHIHALGAVHNITIYNTGTREKMKLDTSKLSSMTGSGIITGDDIIINTCKGHKSVILVRGGQKTNILNCLSRDSDWFKLAKGDNIFAFDSDSGAGNLQFRIENKVVFEGV